MLSLPRRASSALRFSKIKKFNENIWYFRDDIKHLAFPHDFLSVVQLRYRRLTTFMRASQDQKLISALTSKVICRPPASQIIWVLCERGDTKNLMKRQTIKKKLLFWHFMKSDSRSPSCNYLGSLQGYVILVLELVKIWCQNLVSWLLSWGFCHFSRLAADAGEMKFQENFPRAVAAFMEKSFCITRGKNVCHDTSK